MEKRKGLLLMAVFWDYPKFRDENYLRHFLNEKKGTSAYYWVMNRFLERGRVIDTFELFDIKEISESLPKLKLSPHALINGIGWSKSMEYNNKRLPAPRGYSG